MNASVEVEAKRSGPAEYPSVTRLRYRRLLAFLRDQGFTRTAKELAHEMGAYMSLWRLRGLVEQGLWADAIDYLDTYLPPPTRPRIHSAQVLRNFLATHHRFADAAAAAGNKHEFLPKCYADLDHRRIVSRADLRLNSIITSVIGLDHIRAALDWNKVRSQASLAVLRLVISVPELQRNVRLPRACIIPHDVLPIGSGFGRRRRHVKKKQQRSRRRTKAIIRALQRYRSANSRAGSIDEAKELLADYLDETLRAGVLRGSYLSDQPGWKEGAPSWQTMWTSAGKLAEHSVPAYILPSVALKLIAFHNGAPVRQPMPVTLTEAKTSGTSSLTNAGTNKHSSEAGCDTESARQGLDGRKNFQGMDRQLLRKIVIQNGNGQLGHLVKQVRCQWLKLGRELAHPLVLW